MSMITLLPSSAATCPVSCGGEFEVKRAGIDRCGDLRRFVVYEVTHVAVDELLVAVRSGRIAGEAARVPRGSRAGFLIGETLDDLPGASVNDAHRDFDRDAMRRNAARRRADDARQPAARAGAAAAGLVELKDVAGDEIPRAHHVARGDRALGRDLSAGAELVLAQRRGEMRPVEHVEPPAVDHPVGEKIAQGDSRLEVAVPIRGEPLGGEIEDGDRRARLLRGCEGRQARECGRGTERNQAV